MSAKDNYQCGLLFVALDEGEDPTSISAEGAISGWIDDMHLKGIVLPDLYNLYDGGEEWNIHFCDIAPLIEGSSIVDVSVVRDEIHQWASLNQERSAAALEELYEIFDAHQEVIEEINSHRVSVFEQEESWKSHIFSQPLQRDFLRWLRAHGVRHEKPFDSIINFVHWTNAQPTVQHILWAMCHGGLPSVCIGLDGMWVSNESEMLWIDPPSDYSFANEEEVKPLHQGLLDTIDRDLSDAQKRNQKLYAVAVAVTDGLFDDD